jgi:hypothetical protein
MNRSIVPLVLFGALALGCIGALLIFQLNEASKAEDERIANRRSIDVLGALVCERGERPDSDFSKELRANNYIKISPTCQRFVTFLHEELEFDEDRVKIIESVP